MADKRLLDYDPFTGLIQWIHYDESTDETTIETVQDEKQLNKELEATASLRNDSSYTQQGMKNDMLHYAHIPSEVLLKWHSEGIDIKNRKELFRMVNSPDYANLKTTSMVHR
jgi:hypothetical protein